MKSTAHDAAIRVVVVDDHQMLLESLVRRLDGDGGVAVVGSASTVAEGIAAVEAHSPDIVVMDYELPDGDGAAASRQITERWPSVRVSCRPARRMTPQCSRPHGEAALAIWRRPVLRQNPGDGAQCPCRGDRTARRATRPTPPARRPSRPLPADCQPCHQRDRGIEALVRWAHTTRGILPPGTLPLAEKTRLIIDIDEHVRDEA